MEVGNLPVALPPPVGSSQAGDAQSGAKMHPDSRCSGSPPPEWLREAGPLPPQLCGSGPRDDPQSPGWPLKPSGRGRTSPPGSQVPCPEVGVVGAGRRTPHSRHWA